MRKNVLFALSAALLPAGLSARELTVKTVDAFTGVPVPGITVETDIWDEQTTITFPRISDDKGEFRLKRREFLNVTFGIEETDRNYCTGNVVKKFDGKADVEVSVPVALKGKPAKLKIAEVKLNFPPDKDEMRFDFLKGDWLPPEGKGEVADVVFRRMPRTFLGMAHDAWGKPIGERTRDSILVNFLGVENGIRDMDTEPECHLWVRTAPESGYNREYESYWEEDENKNSKKSAHWRKAQCFRIRTQKDESGSVTNCFYGKIYGEFEWFPESDIAPYYKEVKFTYYINETPMDRNLETDRSAPAIHNIRP
jgi:hypothetical protein